MLKSKGGKTYKVQKILEWFHQFDNSYLKLQSENHKFVVKLYDSRLPHLLGLQYMHPKNNINGKTLYDEVRSGVYSDEEILEKVRKNNPAYEKYIEKRIKSFKFMLEHLEYSSVVERTYYTQNSALKSDLFIINEVNFNGEDRFLNLAIMQKNNGKNKNDYFETFFDREDNKYYQNTSFWEKGIKLSILNKETLKFEPFTFQNKNNLDLKSLNQNIDLKEKIDSIKLERIKDYDKNQTSHLINKIDEIIKTQNDFEKRGINRFNFTDIENKIPILYSVRENVEIKNFLEKTDIFNTSSSTKEERKEFMKDMKKVLNLQVILEKNRENLYSKKETFGKINNFFKKTLDDKSIKNALTYLENEKFPKDYIDSFKKNFKNELSVDNKKDKEKDNEININQPINNKSTEIEF